MEVVTSEDSSGRPDVAGWVRSQECDLNTNVAYLHSCSLHLSYLRKLSILEGLSVKMHSSEGFKLVEGHSKSANAQKLNAQ